MSRYSFIPLLLIVIVLISLGRYDLSHAGNGLDGPSQTIPTRKPTPGPTSPPPTIVIPPTSPSGGGDPTESPTPVSPSATPTGPTPTATGTFVQAGSLTPTAEACGDRPTVQALDLTNVRSGPGADFPIIDQMFYLQVNLIVGRAGEAAWWQIGLEDGSTGWVADTVVLVHGYTGGVPVVAAPNLEGVTVTAGAPWDPTPQPSCTITPTPTGSATPTPTESSTPEIRTPEPTPTLSESTPSDDSGTAPPEKATEASTELDTTAEAAAAAATAVSGTDSQPAAPAAASSTPRPTPAPVVIEEPSRAIDLLPVAGVILLIAGIVLSIVRRRRGNL